MEFAVGLAQGAFSLLAFADIVDQRLYDLSAAPFNSGQSHLQWGLFAVGSLAYPIKTRAAVGHAFLNMLPGEHRGAFTTWLQSRRSFARVFTDQLVGALATHNPHCCG